jgi:hypothetical protein
MARCFAPTLSLSDVTADDQSEQHDFRELKYRERGEATSVIIDCKVRTFRYWFSGCRSDLPVNAQATAVTGTCRLTFIRRCPYRPVAILIRVELAWLIRNHSAHSIGKVRRRAEPNLTRRRHGAGQKDPVFADSAITGSKLPAPGSVAGRLRSSSAEPIDPGW